MRKLRHRKTEEFALPGGSEVWLPTILTPEVFKSLYHAAPGIKKDWEMRVKHLISENSSQWIDFILTFINYYYLNNIF